MFHRGVLEALFSCRDQQFNVLLVSKQATKGSYCLQRDFTPGCGEDLGLSFPFSLWVM